MRILKLQPLVDPRSYKLVKSIESFPGLQVSSGVYDTTPYSDYFTEYACASTTFGPLMFPENRFTRMVNWLNYESNLMLWPQNLILSRRIAKMARLAAADVIHTNGASDALGVIAKKNSGLPVVHEIYDTASLCDMEDRRKKPLSLENNPMTIAVSAYSIKRILEWEELVHRVCDAVVYTSEEMRHASERRYGKFKSAVIPNGVLKECLPAQRREKLSMKDGRLHCVYLGAVRSSISHRDIVPQLRSIAGVRNVSLHVYPLTRGREETEELRRSLGDYDNVVVHSPLHYRDLYDEITQYDLGLVILGPRNERLLNTAVPNKVFEYAAAGLPMAIPGYEALKKFVSKYRCGFVVKDWSTDIPQNLGMVKEVPFHEEFTIDHYIPKLMELYRSLV